MTARSPGATHDAAVRHAALPAHDVRHMEARR
jgi:hypothetical protein